MYQWRMSLNIFLSRYVSELAYFVANSNTSSCGTGPYKSNNAFRELWVPGELSSSAK